VWEPVETWSTCKVLCLLVIGALYWLFVLFMDWLPFVWVSSISYLVVGLWWMSRGDIWILQCSVTDGCDYVDLNGRLMWFEGISLHQSWDVISYCSLPLFQLNLPFVICGSCAFLHCLELDDSWSLRICWANLLVGPVCRDLWFIVGIPVCRDLSLGLWLQSVGSHWFIGSGVYETRLI